MHISNSPTVALRTLFVAGALALAGPALAEPSGGDHGGEHAAEDHGDEHTADVAGADHDAAHGGDAHHEDGHHVLDPWADDNHNGTANFLDAEDEHYANSWGHPVWLQWVWHLLNLIVLVGGLGFLARKPIAAALRDRSLGIKKELDDSAELEAEARARHDELEQRLQGFEAEVAQMRTQAEKAAVTEKGEILTRANAAAERISDTAKRTIRDETARATRELRAEAVEIATKLAEDTLRKQLGVKDREQLARDLLTSLGTESATGGTHG